MKIGINTRVGGLSRSDEAVSALPARDNPYALVEALFGETYPEDGRVKEFQDFNSFCPIPHSSRGSKRRVKDSAGLGGHILTTGWKPRGTPPAPVLLLRR